MIRRRPVGMDEVMGTIEQIDRLIEDELS